LNNESGCFGRIASIPTVAKTPSVSSLPELSFIYKNDIGNLLIILVDKTGGVVNNKLRNAGQRMLMIYKTVD